MFICFYKDGKTRTYTKGKKSKFLEKRVLIISAKNTYYIRESFPNTSYENLKNIIKNYVEDLYQDQSMDFCFNIAKIYENSIRVNIFVYKSEILQEVKKEFDFNYVLAEPLCFKSHQNEIVVYKDDLYNILALTKDGLYAYLQMEDFSQEYFDLFLKSLGDFEPKNTVKYEHKLQPVFLDFIDKINLKHYKVSSAFKIDEDFVFRIMIYFLLGYIGALYVNHTYYQDQIKKISYLDDKLRPFIKTSLQEQTPKKNYKKGFIKEYNAQVVKIDPIFIMDNMAKHIKKGEYITQADIKPKNPTTPQANFNISTKSPIRFLESISKDKCIKDFNLESPLMSNPQQIYNVNMKMEFYCNEECKACL